MASRTPAGIAALLDEADALAADEASRAAHGERILQLLEDAAATEPGLRAVVERFAPAEIPLLARSAAFVLASAARAPTDRLIEIIGEFVSRLRRRDDASTLANCWTALQRLVADRDPWPPGSRWPGFLLPFVLTSLEGPAMVQDGALALLWQLHLAGLLDGGLAGSELETLRRAVERSPRELVRHEGAHLADVLAAATPRAGS